MSRAKSPETRQRRNKSATTATLSGGRKGRAPTLPAGIKCEETREWWKVIWMSPMAAEWLPSDRQPLLRLAMLVDQFWYAANAPGGAVGPGPLDKMLAEISKQEARFGLTPYDRHRMDWKIEKPAEKPVMAVADPKVDPREVLRVVK